MNELAQLRETALNHGNAADLADVLVARSGMRLQSDRRRGRGAAINPSGRFEPQTRHAFDDGWTTLEELPGL